MFLSTCMLLDVFTENCFRWATQQTRLQRCTLCSVCVSIIFEQKLVFICLIMNGISHINHEGSTHLRTLMGHGAQQIWPWYTTSIGFFFKMHKINQTGWNETVVCVTCNLFLSNHDRNLTVTHLLTSLFDSHVCE